MDGLEIVYNDADGVLTARGGLVLKHAAKFKVALTEALKGLRGVVLDLASVTDADISGLQLVCAACKSAAALERPLALAGASEALLRTASSAGLATGGCGSGGPTGCGRCIWRKEGLWERG
jgi:anti-anti-sigma factor